MRDSWFGCYKFAVIGNAPLLLVYGALGDCAHTHARAREGNNILRLRGIKINYSANQPPLFTYLKVY